MGTAPQVCVVIDYQNIHLTARDQFSPPGTPPEQVLIDPLRFAERALTVRASRQRDEAQQSARLADVKVFRGAPSNAREPRLYAITQRQRSEWTRDPRVEVTYRTLRYPPNWPSKPAREKGIDVLVALTVVKIATLGAFDVVMLASHDTDLEPALELAVADGQSKIETIGWEGCRVLRPSGKRLWHTALSAADLVHTQGRRSYLPAAAH